MRENSIEWLTGQERVTVSVTQQRFINKIRKLAEDHPEIEIVAENEDGSLCAHVPLRFIKISAPRQVSEEQRTEMAERLNRIRNQQEIR